MSLGRTTLDLRPGVPRVPESGPVEFVPPTDAELRNIRYWIERRVHGNDHATASSLADLHMAERAAGLKS